MSSSDNTSQIHYVGRYQVVSELGRGAMGVVSKGFDPTIGRTVALKTIAFSPDDDELLEFRRRLYGEAAAAGALSHPNIVTIYDVVEDGRMTAIAMEFIEGQTLSSIIRKQGPLPVDKALALFEPICAALDYAGSRGIIHRDIKPANIIVNRDGTPKIADFGIARMSSSTATRSGVILGSPGYMSPEQIRGQKLDRRSDLFSAAAVFYEMIANDRPFDGDDTASLMYRIVNERHRPAHHLNPAIPPALAEVLDRALAKKPDDRFGTGAELIAALREAVAGPSSATLRTPVADPPFDSSRSRVAQGRPFDSSRSRVAQGGPFDSSRSRVAQGGPKIAVSDLPIRDAAAPAEPPRPARRLGLLAGVVSFVAAVAAAGVIVLRGPAQAPIEPTASVSVPAADAAPPLAKVAAPEPLAATPTNPLAAAAEAPKAVAPEPSAGVATAAVVAPPPSVPRTAGLVVEYSGQAYPVVLYAAGRRIGQMERDGVLTVDAGDVRIRAVNESVFLNRDFGSMSLRPGERKPLSIPGLASAVMSVRGAAYEGLRIAVDGRPIAGPYPAQIPRLAEGAHVVQFSWISGALAGTELKQSFDARAGGHFLIRAVPETAEIAIQRAR